MQSTQTLRRLAQRQEQLCRRELALRRREAELRTERAVLRRAAKKLSRETEAQQALRAELAELIDAAEARDLMRRVLRLRYLEGLTLPQTCAALEAEGAYYSERHIDRMVCLGKRALAAAWAEKEERREA